MLSVPHMAMGEGSSGSAAEVARCPTSPPQQTLEEPQEFTSPVRDVRWTLKEGTSGVMHGVPWRGAGAGGAGG